MKNNKASNSQIDFVTPIVEIIQELSTIILKLLFDVLKVGIHSIRGTSPEIRKIERKSLQTKKRSDNQESLGIDTRSKKEVLLDSVDFSMHTFVVGASGFGKTNLIGNLQESYLKKNQPIIFFDPKGNYEAMADFKALCKEYGRKCYIFSESYEESVNLNPILEGTTNQILDRIMNSYEWSEQHYRDESRKALRSAINDLKESNRDVSFQNLYEQLVKNYNTKEASGIITKIEDIIKGDFGRIVGGSENDLTISKIRDEKSCLYIGLSTQGYGYTAKSIGKIFLGELLYNSYKSLNEADRFGEDVLNPIAVFFDEFGALVTPEFIELENKCRGAKMELTMAIQSCADINLVSPELTVQIMENAANWFILKQRVATSASDLSESIGTIISKKSTTMTENGEKSARGTERETHELIVHPDIIKNLSIGQCILLRQNPHQVNLINIRKNGGIYLRRKKNEKQITMEDIFND